MSPDYGGWSNAQRRFIRWRDKGIWEKLLEILIDASHYKTHPHASGARGGNQGMSRTKWGPTPRDIWLWMRMVCRSESLLHKITADCTQDGRPIEGIDADYLLADRGYDSNTMIEQMEKQGMKVVIPTKKM